MTGRKDARYVNRRSTVVRQMKIPSRRLRFWHFGETIRRRMRFCYEVCRRLSAQGSAIEVSPIRTWRITTRFSLRKRRLDLMMQLWRVVPPGISVVSFYASWTHYFSAPSRLQLMIWTWVNKSNEASFLTCKLIFLAIKSSHQRYLLSRLAREFWIIVVISHGSLEGSAWHGRSVYFMHHVVFCWDLTRVCIPPPFRTVIGWKSKR